MMKDSLKWVISGVAGVIFVGTLVATAGLRHHSDSRSAGDGIVQTDTRSGYPAPEVSVVAQEEPLSDAAYALLSNSSSLYGGARDYSTRRHRHSSKHSEHRKTKASKDGLPSGADPEMGLIPADDKKLRDAVAKAEKHAFDPGPVGR